MITSSTDGAVAVHPGLTVVRRFWDRKLDHYPETSARARYLALTVLATIVLYYQLYVGGAVGPKVIHYFDFTFAQINYLALIGAALGAFGSLGAGLADRWGRANLVVYGLLLTSLLTLLVVPNASTKVEYAVSTTVIGIIEGTALVATPALIRDFSPQLRRGTAMGFWSLGPVLGSLVVTEVSSHTLASHPAWQYQFRICGTVGLVVWLPIMFGLRELAPQLRDQLMVSIRDRALIEARATGIDTEKLLRHHWKQMLKLDVVGPALGVSLFLLAYFSFVFLIVGYFQTVFGYTEARANNLANWFWIADAIALIAAGVLSDRLRVRKPFVIAGGTVSLIGLALFAAAATQPRTSYGTFTLYVFVMALGGGVAYVAWMSAFTETVERHNPAATATGLAVWGWIARIVVALMFASVPLLLTSMSSLIDQGPRVRQIVATYPTQVRVLQTVDPATMAGLSKDPHDVRAQAQAVSELSGLPVTRVAAVAALSASRPGAVPATLTPQALAVIKVDAPMVRRAAAELASVSSVPRSDLAYLKRYGGKVATATEQNPGQWQTWWWICFAGQLVFIPLALLLKGRWSPRRAREDELVHERTVERELAILIPGAVEAEVAVG